ncbi:hypothetical protein [Brevundimonas sp.]|uniref:hypothetical protein n=1 Tax=Brevundimonas sp. TaxID=1871086 RepID=UPI002FC9B349
MPFDALRAELWRFSRNTQVWFWALLVIPIGTAIVGVFFRQFLYGQLQNAQADLPARMNQIATAPLNIGAVVADQTSTLAGINLLALFLIGAATIAASDYRWETWRLIRPRDSRTNLVLGKALAIAVIAVIPLLLFLLCELVGQIISATLDNRSITLGYDGTMAMASLAMFATSWLRAVQVGLLALVAAIATRSLFGGFVIAIAFGLGTFMIQRMLLGLGWQSEEWRVLLAFPAAAYETLQTFLAHGPVTGQTAFRAAIGLLSWIIVPVGLSVWLFQRQDLSKE